MHYATPQEMRKSLSHVISSTAAIEAAVDAYFRKLDLPKKAKAPTKEKSKTEEALYLEDMRQASDDFGAAIEAMLAGRNPKTSSELKWEFKTGTEVSNFTGANGYLYVPREAHKLTALGPCFKCGAARGCKHLGSE